MKECYDYINVNRKKIENWKNTIKRIKIKLKKYKKQLKK